MKKLLVLALALFCATSSAITVTVDGDGISYAARVGPLGNVRITGTIQPDMPIVPQAPIVTPPVQPPADGLSCDSSKTRLQTNAQMQPLKAGQATALSFSATGFAHPAVQYNNVSAAVAISTTPCDFAPPQPQCVGVSTVGPGVFTSTSDPRYCLLTEGQTYYMNVRMATRSGSGTLDEACIDGSVSDYFGPGCQFMPF